jgi:AcrR family transcriptional regulator
VTHPPITQRDRRTAVSRRRILDAALEGLVEAGYAGASTLMVQRRAGMSRGGLLHHFPSKDDLFVAAAQHLARARVAETGTQSARPRDPR